MGKQKIKPGTFFQSPVTALAKRGPQGDFRSPNSISEAQGIRDNTTTSYDNLAESPFEKDFFTPQFLGFSLDPVDNSAFNPFSFHDPFNEGIDFEKIRADRQSTINKLGATGVQFIGKTVMGTVGNIFGGFYGMGAAIAQGSTQPLFDNSIYRSVDEANESIEAKNSVFLNRKNGLGMNFELVKDVSDAFSFIASAVAAEAAIQFASAGTGLTTISARMARYLPKMAQTVRALDNAQELEKAALKLGTTVENLAKTKRNIDLFRGGLDVGRKILTTTGYEAGLEARQAKDEFLSNMENEIDTFLKYKNDWTENEKLAYKANFMMRADKDANSVGLTTFLMNTALLSTSNIMQFPTIFGSSYLKAKRLSALENAGLGKVAKAKGKSRFINGVATVGRVLENPIVEFTEETLQKAVSEGTRHYYENILGVDTDSSVLLPSAQNFTNSVWHGLKKAYGTEEGLHEGIIGGIVGAIGLPGLKRVGNKNKLSWQGGVYGDIKKIRETQKYTESALNSVNNASLSEAIKYKKDNAILSTLDADKEDAAIIKEDRVEFDDVQDNKVFRYTTERMRNGLETFIDEDIAELSNMDLDKYKASFEKEEGFTQKDKDEEIEQFKEKTNTYKDAFKKVHKGLDFGRYSYDTAAHDKLTNILTHAVATQKLHGRRLEALKQELGRLNITDFTPEQIDEFVKTSGKVKQANAEIEAYIKEKDANTAADNNARFRGKDALKTELDPIYSYLLDLSKEQLQEQKQSLEQEAVQFPENVSEESTKVLKNLNKALELKDEFDSLEYKKFEAKKSPVVRKKLKSLEELAKEINDKIASQTSESLKQIGKLPKTVTVKELEAYINKKVEIAKQINKQNDSTYILDKPDTVIDGNDLLNEIQSITNSFTTATEIAASLYGFKDSPSHLYSKIKAGELFANIANAKKQINYLLYLSANTTNKEEFLPLIENLEATLEVIEKDYKDLEKKLTKESKKSAKESIKFIKLAIKQFNKYIGNKETLKKQIEKAKEAAEPEANVKQLVAEADIFKDESDEDADPIDVDKAVDKAINDKFNRLTINESKETGDNQESNPNFPELKDAIEEGLIKHKAATTLVVQNDLFDLDKNTYLKNILEKKGLLEKFNRGLEKVEKNPESINDHNKDEDIHIFIKYAPIHLNIYNKVADKVEKHYEFEIAEEDKVIYQQFLYSPDDISEVEHLDNKKEFEKEIATLKAWQELELNNKKRTKKSVYEEYDSRYREIENKVFYKERSVSSNFKMRLDVLKNFYSGVNELKLKVHTVDQGDFENFKNKKKIVTEHHVDELGFDAQTIHIEDMMYANKDGELVSIARKKVDNITDYKGTGKPHPLKGKKGTSKNMFFAYKDKSGKTVQIKMNMAKLTPKDIDLILREFENYALSTNRAEYTVKISEKEHPLLGKLKNLPFYNGEGNDFLSFFLTPLGGRTSSPLFVKNTYKLNPAGNDGTMKFSILNEGFSTLELSIPIADGNNDTQIKKIIADNKEELRSNLNGQRHNFNVNFMASEGVLNRDALAFMFDNKIINHAFNATDNFDNIYDRGTYDETGKRTGNYNRRIVISRADVNDEVSTGRKVKTLAEELKDLRGSIETKDKKYQANITDLVNSISTGIRTSIQFRLGKEKDNLSKVDKDKLLDEAIQSVIQGRIDEVLGIGKDHPGSITVGRDHENAQGKAKSDDKVLDTLLIWLYHYKNTISKDKTYRTEIKKRMEHWNALRDFLERFQNPPAGNNFSMMSFVKDSDGTAVESKMQSPEQVESLMRIINMLDELTSRPGIDFIDINYVETFPAAIDKNGKAKSYARKFKSSEGLKQSQLDNSHYKTRLKSVQIEEQPIWKDGKLVAGEVYFNFGSLDAKGKQGNQKVLVLSKDMALDRPINIMTSISLPFISVSTFELNEDFDSMVKDIYDNIGIDTKLRNVLESKFPKTTVSKKTKEDVDLNALITEQLVEEKPTAVVPKQKILNKATLDSKSAKTLFGNIDTLYTKNFKKGDKISDKRKENTLKSLSELGISNLTSYITALGHYNSIAMLEVSESNIAFGEALFNEKREDCE